MRARMLLLMVLVASAAAQTAKPGTTAPQGSSIPGLSGVSWLDGPGSIEIGGSRSDLTQPLPSWTDFYIRGSIAPGEKNVIQGEVDREGRYGDAGWFYSAGLTRTLSQNLFTDVHLGTSVGGFFLPKYRVDGFINYKMLAHRQFVGTAGVGYDKSKTVNSAIRTHFGGTYYFEWPLIVQGGVTLTRANPGSVLAPTGYASVTQGREKEHYITLRAEMGREGYELVGNQASRTTLFNFPIHKYSGTWRQWIGNNWGLNFNFEREINPFFNRNGATLGLFVDF
jgi:YaiO family outer membrane protein